MKFVIVKTRDIEDNTLPQLLKSVGIDSVSKIEKTDWIKAPGANPFYKSIAFYCDIFEYWDWIHDFCQNSNSIIEVKSELTNASQDLQRSFNKKKPSEGFCKYSMDNL